jgi:hypothetical protein
MSKYQDRSRHTCEYLESIGIDPNTVLEEGANEAGYREIVLDEQGRRSWDHVTGSTRAKLREWPNGPSDFIGFMRARDRDWHENHPNEE